MELLMKILSWIDERIIEIATTTLVGVTISYARTTKKILKESERVRLDAKKPTIAIFAGERYETLGRRDEAQSLFLCVENVSTGAAYDVNLELADPSFSLPTHHGSRVRLLKDIPLIAHGISYLPPGHDRSYRLSNAHEYGEHNKLAQRQLQIKVTYKDSNCEKYKDCIDIDFRIPARR